VINTKLKETAAAVRVSGAIALIQHWVNAIANTIQPWQK
jgi:hypothetical protein